MIKRGRYFLGLAALSAALLLPLQLRAAESEQAESGQAESTSAQTQPASESESKPELQPAAPAESQALGLRLTGGLNIRTDYGVHSTRLDFGVRYQDYELDLVLDRMFWTNGQAHTDLLLQWHNEAGFSGFGGYRLSLIPLLDGPQSQHNLLLGCAADLPQFFGGLLRGQAGFELAMTLVKAGGGLPAEYISFESGRSYIDLVNMALFIRLNTGIDL